MKRKIIKTTKDYQAVLLWIDEMFQKKIQPNTKEGKQLQRALLSVKKFEDVFYAVPLPKLTSAFKNKKHRKKRCSFYKLFVTIQPQPLLLLLRVSFFSSFPQYRLLE